MLCITKGVPSCVPDTPGSRPLADRKRSFFLRVRERWISGQNGAGEPHDYDSALYNDTSRKGDGAGEAGGTPMRYTRYRYKVFF